MEFGKDNKKGRGRPKGSQNKTAIAVKEALESAFNDIGGIKALVKWAKKPENQGDFYKLYAKLLPKDVNVKTSDPTKSEPIPETNRWLGEVIAARPADAPKGTLPH